MKMMEIFAALEIERKSAEVMANILANEKDELEKQILELQEKLEDVMPRYERAKDNLTSITMSMEALTAGDFSLTVDEQKAEEKFFEEEKYSKEDEPWEGVIVTKPTKRNDKYSSVIVKYGKNGQKLGTYTSQSKIAEQLGVSQHTVCNYMKQEKDIQLMKRGYYLQYEN